MVKRETQPAQTFVERDGKLWFHSHRFLGVVDASDGSELYFDCRFEAGTVPEVLQRGGTRVWATPASVEVERGDLRRSFEGAWLYGCRADDVPVIVHGDHSLSTIDGDGNVTDAEGARRHEGAVIGYYYNSDQTVGSITYDDGFVGDGLHCWDASGTPETSADSRWKEVRPVTAATTTEGHAVLVTSRYAGTYVRFLPFQDPRDVDSCRRVLSAPALPANWTLEDESPAANQRCL